MFLLQSSGRIHHRQGSRTAAIGGSSATSHAPPAAHGISTSASANPIGNVASNSDHAPTTILDDEWSATPIDAVALSIPHSQSFDQLHDDGDDKHSHSRRLAAKKDTPLADSLDPLADDDGPASLALPSSSFDALPKSIDFPTGSPHSYTQPLLVASASSTSTITRLPLYRWAQVPEYLQFNPYILTHYRSGYSFRQAWVSLTALHNETGNIWTHLVPIPVFFYFTFFCTSLFSPLWPDRLVLALYLLSAIKCFACSSMFHACYCINHAVYMQFGCLDYQGISVLISGGAVALTYAAMYAAAPQYAWIKLLAMAGAAGISLVGIVGPKFPIWHTAVFRARRTAIYVSAGLLGTVTPIAWLVFVDGGVPTYANLWWGTNGWKVVVAALVFGVSVYVGKLPERWWPGAFDLVGHSHQWWHVAVVAAVVAHGLFVGQLIQWRVTEGELR
ncbi:hemolysin-III related-domain-containing protein [Catenaria anguillulae PL171]|uniref:Hemolysin-III related-domain-containing protein n=1 Tax=Catenaria anguillulae PL171 TaxID=765915 RepID=A0A1Y2HWB5_9FUNG|nr:hemolysin-III related-domain-containing protein [Catenaria anguillulae PL171]